MCNDNIIWKALSRGAAWNNTSAGNIQFGLLAEWRQVPQKNWAMSCVNAEGNPPEHSWQNAPEPAMQEPATREPSILEPSTTQPLPRSTVLLVPKPTWPSCCQGLRHGWCQGACHSPFLFHLSTQDWCSPAPQTFLLLQQGEKVMQDLQSQLLQFLKFYAYIPIYSWHWRSNQNQIKSNHQIIRSSCFICSSSIFCSWLLVFVSLTFSGVHLYEPWLFWHSTTLFSPWFHACL